MAISVNDKDLGLVTAYAYAVAGGYTGTEAEFEELLGNIAEDLSEIENLSVEIETLSAGSQATASYSNGVLSLGIPRGDTGATGPTGPTGPQGPQGIPGDVANLAPAYDPDNGTYSIGRYCIENGQLQRCIVPIDTPEPFTAAHWMPVAIGNDVADLKGALINDEYEIGVTWKVKREIREKNLLTFSNNVSLNGLVSSPLSDNRVKISGTSSASTILKSSDEINLDHTKTYTLITYFGDSAVRGTRVSYLYYVGSNQVKQDGTAVSFANNPTGQYYIRSFTPDSDYTGVSFGTWFASGDTPNYEEYVFLVEGEYTASTAFNDVPSFREFIAETNENFVELNDIAVLHTKQNYNYFDYLPNHGEAISPTGGHNSRQYYWMSDFIPVKQGDKINYKIIAADYVAPVCLFSTNAWGTTYFVASVTGLGENTYTTGEFTVSQDGYVVFSAYRPDLFPKQYIYFSDIKIPDNVRIRFETDESSIATINEKLDVINGRSYMQTEIARVESLLKEKIQLGNVVIIAFNTDQHLVYPYTDPAIRGLRALSMMTRKIPFNLVVLGGDAAGADAGGESGTVAGIIDDVLAVNAPLYDADCPVVSITGNHDANQNNPNITNGEMYKTNFQRYVQKYGLVPKDFGSTNGYLDDYSANIRYIFCDTTSRYDGETVEYDALTQVRAWLTSCLSTLPEGYKAVLFGHHPLTDEFNGDVSADTGLYQGIHCQDILDDYADKIICDIAGHWHKSASAKDSAGINYIQVTSASYDADISDRGTAATETAYDIFVIDQTEEKIYTIRFGAGGAGANRTFTY